MKKRALTIAALSAALLLGGATVAVVAAQQTQKDVQAQLGRTQKALTESGLARMVSEPYQGTAFGGTQVTTITLMPETADPMVIKLNSRVYNGPFPQGKRFGAATVITDVQFEPGVQAELDRAFGGQKISLRTDIQFGGNSVTTFNVPAGTITAEGTTMRWQAASGTVRATEREVLSAGQWPGLLIEDKDMRLTMGATSWQLNASQQPDTLGDGKAQFTLASLEAGAPGGQALKLDRLTVTSTTRSQGPLMSSAVGYGAERLEVAGKTLNKLQLNVTLNNLDRKAMEQLSALTRTEKMPEDAAVNALITALLKAGPTLVLDRLSVGQGKDEVKFTGQVGFKGAPTTDWAAVLDSPELLMGLLDVRLHGEGEAQALNTLAATLAPDPSMAQGLIQAGEENGLLVRRGSRLVTDLNMDQAGLKVNGQPLQ
ncbi:DUF945 family protein [Deinococcus aquaedulcis]|uniref:DUF945 family protein n=1 Tax=Deinococcus aquaedulcis TaxID=2840455 RepID=UPI001C82E06C|nr:DUF945 family protein [Deinococcus aquaedulcis]